MEREAENNLTQILIRCLLKDGQNPRFTWFDTTEEKWTLMSPLIAKVLPGEQVNLDCRTLETLFEAWKTMFYLHSRPWEVCPVLRACDLLSYLCRYRDKTRITNLCYKTFFLWSAMQINNDGKSRWCKDKTNWWDSLERHSGPTLQWRRETDLVCRSSLSEQDYTKQTLIGMNSDY